MTMSELCERIGVSPSNASSKSREIWKVGPHAVAPGLVPAEYAGGEPSGHGSSR